MADDRANIELTELVAEYHEAVYRYAYRLSGSAPDAEDLTQQVFMIVQQKLAQLRNAESARAWLFTILRNCFIKSCKKRYPLPVGDLQINIDSIPEVAPRGEEIDGERLQNAINALPPPYRIVLAMFYFENLSYREIAEQLDLPIGTVMSRLARAKGQLRSELFDANAADERRQADAAKSRG